MTDYSPERVAIELGLDMPNFDVEGYYGASYGTMKKPYHIVGNLLFLSGHVAQRGTEVRLAGRLGDNLTTEQGYQAARFTAIRIMRGDRASVGVARMPGSAERKHRCPCRTAIPRSNRKARI